MMHDDAFLELFSNTLSADKSLREAAEASIAQLSAVDASLVVRLLHLACLELPSEATPTAHHAQLAVAIRVRNVLTRSDWNRQPYFTPEVKAAVRESIVPLHCAAHVPERIRRQILATIKDLIAYDYPKNWPSLMPQLVHVLNDALVHLSGNGTVSCDAVLRLKGSLSVLRECCRAYENPMLVEAVDLDAFANDVLPLLLSTSERLVEAWVKEFTLMAEGTTVGSLSPLDFSPLHEELSHCLRFVIKCVQSLVSGRWPHFLCDPNEFERLVQGCLGQLLMHAHTLLLPASQRRIVSFVSENSNDDSDLASLFQLSAAWRLVKWVESLCFCMVTNLVPPSETEKRARVVAQLFADRHVTFFVQQALDLVRWHATPRPVTSKAYIMALEILNSAVSVKSTYCAVIAPNAEELLTFLLFNRLGFSAADTELWGLNPEEYVRVQTDPAGDLFNARVQSASLMLALALPTKRFHNNTLSSQLVQFLLGQLEVHAQGAYNNGDMTAARIVDATLFAVYQMSRALTKFGFDDAKIEWLLMTYVAPAAKSPVGFLRARSALLVSDIAPRIQWSSPGCYQTVLGNILPLLQDTEVPVRIQTCTSLSRLICHPHAREVITPCIGELMNHYFQAMCLMDNEGVVLTMRKTIRFYRDVLSQWALQLTELLVQHFANVLHRVEAAKKMDDASSKLVEGGEDTMTESLLTADELLETLTTLVQALPMGSEALVAEMQRCIAPMLSALLFNEEGGFSDFMDPALMLLTSLLSRSSTVCGELWQLVAHLHRLILIGAVDYFGLMLPPLDNFVSVAPRPFLLAPLNELGAVPPFAQEIATMTPAEIVGVMCDSVLNARENLRPQELSSVPQMYDAILQNVWRLREQDPTVITTRMDNLVEYLTRAALRVLAESVSQQQQQSQRKMPRWPRTLTLLFVNSIFSAILANPCVAVRVLMTDGVFTPLFAQYVQLVSDAELCAMLRSYDRRLFAMAMAGLMRMVQEGTAPDITHAVDEVLCGVLQSGVLGEYSVLEGDMALEELKYPSKVISGAADTSSDEDEEDEDWIEEEDEEDEDDEDEDGEWDNADGENHNEGSISGNNRLQSLVAQAAAARRGHKDGINPMEGTNHDDDEGDFDDDAEEEDVLDKGDFVSPIDDCNAWEALVSVATASAKAGVTVQFVQSLQSTQPQMKSIVRTGRIMEEVMAARERHIKGGTK